MIKNINTPLLNKHEIDIGWFYFYENFVIGNVNEGLDLNFDSGKKLYELIQFYYKDQIPFTYISQRINSYSFKPTRIYGAEDYFPNLKGYAIVIYDPVNYKVAKLEETFTAMPTYITNDLEDAIDWSNNIISIKE
ncbi:hypothetical protein M0D21_10720 [Aquimarina sp. D1M17]|uniref:hypothetical protein n=1 Tax=Aquimarina acroporae TaxID=2937283 RepID=UPI0020BF9E1B|nr:hypothetical protein [Aquimarina acroporae]MCK8522043.1 hypothetical protein [Aquimarina acroporae]